MDRVKNNYKQTELVKKFNDFNSGLLLTFGDLLDVVAYTEKGREFYTKNKKEFLEAIYG